MYINGYEHLDLKPKNMWSSRCREYLAQQPFIKDMIIDSLFWKPHQSWRQIEGNINSWCSHMVIAHFCKSFDSFDYYEERIISLFSPRHKDKHLEFIKLVYERNLDLLDGNGIFFCGKGNFFNSSW